MSKCKCGNKIVTLKGIYSGDLETDSEPYENGVEEQATNEDVEFIDSHDINVDIGACSKCKKFFLYIDDKEIEIQR